MSSLGGAPSTPAKKNNKKNAKKAAAKQEEPKQNDSQPQENGANQPQANAPSSLGAPPKPASSLGGPPSSLGGPPKATLGGPPSSLGGPPKATLGAPPSSLGGPPKPASSLGGPPSALGGPPKAAEANNNNNNNNEVKPADGEGNNESTEGEAKAKNKKKEKKKKKPAAQPAPAVKKPADKAALIAAKIKKEREEEEKRKRQEEELRRLEEERIRQEEEEEKKRQEELLARIAKKKQKVKDMKKNKKNRMAQQKNQEVLRQLMAQGAVVNVEGKIVPKAKEAKKEKSEEDLRREKKDSPSSPEVTPEVKEEEVDDWESLLSDDEDNKKDTKSEETAETDQTKPEDKRKFRSPICCVLGHVDTGKTLLLDKIRKSNVQKGEAGGITQQIGATYFPLDAIQNLTNALTTNVISSAKGKKNTAPDQEELNQIMVPGLLIIDTPGHESFTNLRTRGSSLCDIAILVVDIMHGIEQQTEESIRLLKQRKTPFIVALNKIDRLNDWKPNPNAPIRASLEKQSTYVQKLYEEKVRETITLFAEKGLNASLYYQNQDFRKFVSIVPTSAVTGEGIPDLLMLLIQLTQRMMTNQLYISDELKCTVLEVKVTEGLGTTIDVILSDGTIREGDKIVVCGKNGPIVTSIRSLLTPQALREIRVKSIYQHHKEITAAQGIKIVAKDLDEAVAGTQLFVVREGDDIEVIKEEVQSDLENIQNIDRQDVGVYVQASTLGSLEALLCFLKESNIPVANVGIGNIHKKDVTRASVMVEKEKKYACILAFDVKISPEIQQFAESMGVTVFSAPIIYHLEQAFSGYLEKIESEKRKAHASEAVWPCVLEIFSEHIFNKRNPIVLGVKVVRGELKLLTPICVIKENENLYLGRVASIEENHKSIEAAKAGSEVAIKIEHDHTSGTPIYAYERHFDFTHQLMSRITRHSLDRLKEFFGSSLSKKDIKLLREMKEIYNVD